MKKLAILLITILTSTAFGFMDYFPDTEITSSDKEVLDLIDEWNKNVKTPVTYNDDGSVAFLYGYTQPVILTAVMQVTDVQLEAGEKISSMHIGDRARWIMEPAMSNSPSGEITHIIIKPKDSGLETTVIITTNRRTYHFSLKSHKSKFFPKVSFIYPEKYTAKWNNLAEEKAIKKETNRMIDTDEQIDKMSFNYEIIGNASFKPVRVYNNGIKTFIQLPESALKNEIPTLLIMDNGQSIVNYRLHEDRFIVDSLFSKAVMILGVGMKQIKITINKLD